MIKAINLTKRHENGQLALDALNLTVAAGEIYSLLGANGSGKTTVINLFRGLIKPTSGRALINDIDITDDPIEAKKHVAYLASNAALYGHLTARQNLDFFARLGGKRQLNRDDCDLVLRDVGLQEKLFERKAKNLTKGARQKVSIGIAIIRDTPAILLDDPMLGLDPKAGDELAEILDQMRQRGKAILMSTYDIFRAREIADRIGIIREGRKVIERTSNELEQEDLEALYLNYMRGGHN